MRKVNIQSNRFNIWKTEIPKSTEIIRGSKLSKKQITSLCPMQDTGCLGLMHGDDPERCYGEGGGRGIYV